MQNMSLSIIVPVHNSASTIERCVTSIVDQQVDNLEIILVENNSTDLSYDICQGISQKYNFVKVISTKEKGVSNARNIGLSHCSSEIVGFCDADDTIPLNAYKAVINAFKQHPDCDIVFGGYNVLAGNKIGTKKYLTSKKWVFKKLMMHVLYDSKTMGAMWNKFFKKEIIIHERFEPSISMCEDMHFCVRLLNKAGEHKAFYLNEVVYNYNLTEKSATGNAGNLYDEHDDLKYFFAFDNLLYNDFLPSNIHTLAKRQKCELAIREFLYGQTSQNQRTRLKRVIKENIGIFVLLFWLTPLNTCRYIVKLLIVLFNK